MLPAKNYVDTHFGDFPWGIGDALRDIPLWMYAASATFVTLGVLFTAYEVILGIRNKAMLRLQGSNLGIAKEKKRILSEAANFAKNKNFSRAAEIYLSAGEDEACRRDA
jgi:hypothetical protein